MKTISRIALFAACFLFGLPGVRAETEAGIIIASVVAGLVLVVGVVAVSVFCFKRYGGCEIEDDTPKKNKRRHKKHHHKHHHHQSNGVYPSSYTSQYPPQYHVNNGYVHEPKAFVTPIPQKLASRPQTRPVVYPTYHGPPPEFVGTQQQRPGTLSGLPPTIVIPLERGTVTMRPDLRPVIKTRQYKPKDVSRDERRNRSKSRERSHEKSKQEFVIQQSYDGIPVIRPVIYVDDDRPTHRSKSKSRSKSRERPEQATTNVITIPYETQTAEVHASDKEDRPATETYVSRASKVPTPPPPPVRSPERSRASSVTGALNAMRMSTRDHVGDDSDSDSSKAPSFNWAANTDKSPDPRAGDVMFYPAGTEHSADTNKQADNQDQIYGYTTVIKQSMRESVNAPERPSTSAQHDAGYEVPKQVRDSFRASGYETELSQTTRNYNNNNNIGASMSDRLQSLVEDGDKTRFTRYNVGAVNFEDEDKTEDEEPVKLRVRTRPDTPPTDFPRDSNNYSHVPPETTDAPSGYTADHAPGVHGDPAPRLTEFRKQPDIGLPSKPATCYPTQRLSHIPDSAENSAGRLPDPASAHSATGYRYEPFCGRE